MPFWGLAPVFADLWVVPPLGRPRGVRADRRAGAGAGAFTARRAGPAWLAATLSVAVFARGSWTAAGRPALPGEGQSLALDRTPLFRAPVQIAHEDLDLRFDRGAVFAARANDEIVMFVLAGSGTLTVSPPIPSEQRQLQMFTGAPQLRLPVTAALLEAPSGELAGVLRGAAQWQGAPPADLAGRAARLMTEYLDRGAGRVAAGPGAVGYQALPPGDLVLLAATSRGRPLYTRAAARPEDLMLVDLTAGRRVLAYPSAARRLAWGWQFGDEYGRRDEVIHYDIDVTVDPVRRVLTGRTGLTVRALQPAEVLSLRLDRNLIARGVVSRARGALPFVQQREQDTLLVRVDPPLRAADVLGLEVSYSGVVAPQSVQPASLRDREDLATGGAAGPDMLLYSNRVYWFPQSPVRNHTTATIRATVPPGFVALGTGIPQPASPIVNADGTVTFVLQATAPARYHALLVGRFVPVVTLPADARQPVAIEVVAVPGLVERARPLAPQVAEIVRFVASWVGEAPYPRLTVALVDAPLPAAHSPAYLTVFGEPAGWDARSAEDDPAYFREDTTFFLAHEIAHQWWGHAVGWRNYREQWLSEGFAQYFAALHLREARGEAAFARVLGWLHRWARRARAQGPISLGLRAGELGDDPRRFTAVVYCRAAYVLHMLRALVGEETFRAILQQYAERWRFRRAGTDDLRAVAEAVSGLDLARFFDQWVRQDGEPDLRYRVVAPARAGEPLRLDVEQVGEPFDVPLDVTIEYHDRPAWTTVVRVSAARQQFQFALDGRLRRVRVNDRLTALGEVRPR